MSAQLSAWFSTKDKISSFSLPGKSPVMQCCCFHAYEAFILLQFCSRRCSHQCSLSRHEELAIKIHCSDKNNNRTLILQILQSLSETLKDVFVKYIANT